MSRANERCERGAKELAIKLNNSPDLLGGDILDHEVLKSGEIAAELGGDGVEEDADGLVTTLLSLGLHVHERERGGMRWGEERDEMSWETNETYGGE